MSLPFADFIDILGTFSFAVSGAFAAMEKRLDLLGVFILAFITSIGGGTIRDMLIGNLPVAWMLNPQIGWVIAVGAVGALYFGRRLKKMQYLLNIFDALGLGLFTLIGIHKGISHHLSHGVCVALGTVTGCFGGVLRDVFLNKVPLIFQKEIYASASIAGGAIYFFLISIRLEETLSAAISIFLICMIRMMAIHFKWHLPVRYEARNLE